MAEVSICAEGDKKLLTKYFKWINDYLADDVDCLSDDTEYDSFDDQLDEVLVNPDKYIVTESGQRTEPGILTFENILIYGGDYNSCNQYAFMKRLLEFILSEYENFRLIIIDPSNADFYKGFEMFAEITPDISQGFEILDKIGEIKRDEPPVYIFINSAMSMWWYDTNRFLYTIRRLSNLLNVHLYAATNEVIPSTTMTINFSHKVLFYVESESVSRMVINTGAGAYLDPYDEYILSSEYDNTIYKI